MDSDLKRTSRATADSLVHLPTGWAFFWLRLGFRTLMTNFVLQPLSLLTSSSASLIHRVPSVFLCITPIRDKGFQDL